MAESSSKRSSLWDQKQINQPFLDSIKEVLIMDSILKFKPKKDAIDQYAKTPSPEVNSLLSKLGTLIDAGVWEEVLSNCGILLDFIWEKLNTGHWKEVDISWRYAYSVVSLCHVMALLQNGTEPSQPSLKSALKRCDMGLLMGAPIQNNVLAKLGSKIHSLILSDSVNDGKIASTSSVAHECDQTPSKRPKLSSGKEIPRKSAPSIMSFSSDNLSTRQPLVITGVIENWPAFHKWNIEHIRGVAGERTVPVEIGSKYTEESWSQKLMTINEFCDRFIGATATDDVPGYLAQHQLFDQIEDLKQDILLPDYCCLLGDEDDVDVNGWFGPGGTVSPLHQDPRENLLAQVFGSKLIRLYGTEETEKVYPNSEGMMTNTSQVDVEHPDLERFPKFAQAEYSETILGPGEMLYIPKQWWHYVRSLEPSFSVSFWFGD